MSAGDLPHQRAPHLRRLRLSGILDPREVRTQPASGEQWSSREFLARLIQDEAERREHKARDLRLRRGQVNTPKTLETFDFGFNASINRHQVYDLATCTFLRQRRNVLICGQTGVGKTHLVQALAHEAARQGFEVLYTSADHLLRQIHAGRADGTVDKRRGTYLAPDLLVIDDFGLKRRPPTGPVDLYAVISGRYEKGSSALTSNRAPAEGPERFGDALLANAALDRLAHQATVLRITGRSDRLAHRPGPSEVPMP